MTIRKAEVSDLQQITQLFRSTVREVNSKHYSPEQIEHWASSTDDLPKWRKRIEDWYFIVAEEDKILGFAYLNDGNYFDALFVHHQHQGKGIASLLADHIEAKAKENGYDTIHSDVSETAKPFFAKRGYTIENLQRKEHRGMIYENYIVSKQI